MHFCNLFVVGMVGSLIYFCRGDEVCANVDEDGACLEYCLESSTMYVYQPGCYNETMSQKTCRQPEAISLGYICDYVSCECYEPLVWDEAAKKCVQPENCSDQTKIIEEEKIKRRLENEMAEHEITKYDEDYKDYDFLL